MSGRLVGWDLLTPDRDVGRFYFSALGFHVADDYIPASATKGFSARIAITDLPKVARRVIDHGGAIDGAMPTDDGKIVPALDPFGVPFTLLVPKKPVPATNVVGWIEAVTEDVARLLDFFSGVLGWKDAGKIDVGGDEHRLFETAEGVTGAITRVQKGSTAHWLPYAKVGDVAEVVSRASTVGGKAHFGPWPLPNGGQIGAVCDPHGTSVGLWQPAPGTSTPWT